MISITPSDIIQYQYCPRFVYFERVLRIPQYEEKSFKAMEGRHLHEVKSEQNKAYLRQRIGVQKKMRNVYLTNEVLRGEVDEVLFLHDGTAAPLDYKFARWEEKLYSTYHTQLLCYAWLISDNFGVPVHRGFLVYIRSSNYLLEVPITGEAVDRIKDIVGQIRQILEGCRYPDATRVRSRCDHCTYRNICTQ